MDIRLRAQLAAKDRSILTDGKPTGVLTILIHQFCDNDPEKFERLCNLIQLIQDETIRLSLLEDA